MRSKFLASIFSRVMVGLRSLSASACSNRENIKRSKVKGPSCSSYIVLIIGDYSLKNISTVASAKSSGVPPSPLMSNSAFVRSNMW